MNSEKRMVLQILNAHGNKGFGSYGKLFDSILEMHPCNFLHYAQHNIIHIFKNPDLILRRNLCRS